MGKDVGGLGTWYGSSYASTTATVTLTTTILTLIVSTVAIFLSSTFYSLYLSRKLRQKAQRPLPPGGFGLSIVEEFVSFLSNPDSFHPKKHAQYGPICRSNVLGKTVFLEPPIGNKFLFANEAKLVQVFAPKPIIKLVGRYALSIQTGVPHKRLRRHVMPFLSPPALAQYIPRIERHTIDHLAEFWRAPQAVGGHESEEFHLSIFESMRRATFAVIADLVLSLKSHESDELRKLYLIWGKGLSMITINLPGSQYRRALKARGAIFEILDKLIARRRGELKEGATSPSQDLLSYLLSTPDETGVLCSDEEIKDNILLFLFAGHETSSIVMTMTLRSIALHPEVQQQLKKEQDTIAERKGPGDGLTKEDLAEMKYTWSVIQETMRVQAPVRFGFREAIQDFEFGGYTIPKGWKVWWSTHSHVDPKFFDDPEKFDPTRFNGDRSITPYTYTPFGGGSRICPGNEFAKMEMLIFFHYVVRNYTFTLVNPDEPITRDVFPKQKSGTLMKVRKTKVEPQPVN